MRAKRGRRARLLCAPGTLLLRLVGPRGIQFVIPVCPFQLVISEAGPTQGALLFLLLSHQQAPLGPALQDSTTSALYRAPLPLVESF
jgi:hypothetical protein